MFTVNYGSWEGKPTYREYANVLQSRVPTLFSNTHRTVVTEFGRSMVGKVRSLATTLDDLGYFLLNLHLASSYSAPFATDMAPFGTLH